MGKQRIQALLDQLGENHQQDIQNAAAIYSVAQVAVNQLDGAVQANLLRALPPAVITKEDLLARYQSYAGCRKAAKSQGIRFKKTPSWMQLICAFSYVETFQQLSKAYRDAYPNSNLTGTKFELEF